MPRIYTKMEELAGAVLERKAAGETNKQIGESYGLTQRQIELLVIAKGYKDCVAYVTENGISVAVAAPEGGLQQADVAIVADVVMSQSDFTLNDIRVIEVPQSHECHLM